ncbi:hypothetical protein DFJ58DRAFT_823189 [Suillus subalutaceus]|uniref:uncharacterized protein n=1 Tax=Suillus subalutaceus TaxID=48586 RepID=UPI001B87AB3B|nr:uncharacterized protein DFJ58DRAFT_823189 [Suillus subalutaceus]KAG1832319.1 hypothetical protein DFJ58DRAFT_823189 [Suillus subalutaceus]
MSDDDTFRNSDPFDKGSSIRRLVIFGSVFSILVGLGFIVGGVYMWIFTLSNQSHVHGLLYFKCHVPSEVPSLALNLIVTVCTECAGVVHSRTLRFALFQERRATYNSNLRLLTGSDEKAMNSATINGLMALLLIISYSSSSFLFRDLGQYIWSVEACGVMAIPAIVLGMSIFLQTCISLSALRNIEIPTWSTSPFDTIPALRLIHRPQCLKKHYLFADTCTCVGTPPDTTKPKHPQPSAWNTRKGVRRAIYFLWGLAIICMFWGLWVYLILPDGPSRSWAFFPGPDNYGEDAIPGDYWWTQQGISFATWLSLYALMVITQGSLTLGLHCVELVAGVVRDETIWRGGKDGSNSGINSSWFRAFMLRNWLHIVLFCTKPVLHWLFGLAVEIYIYEAVTTTNVLDGYTAGIDFYSAQIFYLGFCLFIVAITFTLAACHHPKGAQLATYGHIKTLLDLDNRQEAQSCGHTDGGSCHQ